MQFFCLLNSSCKAISKFQSLKIVTDSLEYITLHFHVHFKCWSDWSDFLHIYHAVAKLVFDTCPFCRLNNDGGYGSYFRGCLKTGAYLERIKLNKNIKLPTCFMTVFRTKQMRYNLWALSVIGGESLESIWDLSLSPVKSFPCNWSLPSWLLPNLRPPLLHNSMLEYV